MVMQLSCRTASRRPQRSIWYWVHNIPVPKRCPSIFRICLHLSAFDIAPKSIRLRGLCCKSLAILLVGRAGFKPAACVEFVRRLFGAFPILARLPGVPLRVTRACPPMAGIQPVAPSELSAGWHVQTKLGRVKDQEEDHGQPRTVDRATRRQIEALIGA